MHDLKKKYNFYDDESSSSSGTEEDDEEDEEAKEFTDLKEVDNMGHSEGEENESYASQGRGLSPVREQVRVVREE